MAVSRKVAPAPETVLQLVERAKSQPQFLQMGDVGIDDMLKGGFNAGGITEIVGMAGMGKTQICLTLAVVATMAESCGGSGGRTLFIDTESRFNTSRLLEIAANKFPDAFTSDNDTQDLAERVLVSRPRTCAELMVTLSNLQNYVIEHSIKYVTAIDFLLKQIHMSLPSSRVSHIMECIIYIYICHSIRCIIVDSIAALPRSEYSNDHIIQRQEMLGRQAIAMKAAAEKFCIPVVVTNQVTTRLSPSETEDGYGSYITAALGTKWAHCVNTRIMLHQPSIDGTLYILSRQFCFSLTHMACSINIAKIILSCLPVTLTCSIRSSMYGSSQIALYSIEQSLLHY